jgi:hypothetical protein
LPVLGIAELIRVKNSLRSCFYSSLHEEKLFR